MCSRQAASGRPCRRICRPRARRITISCCGTGTARWSASTRHSTSRCASRPAAKRARTAAIIDSQSAKAAQKGALRSIRKASMRARRSRVASATSSSTRSASCSASAVLPPTSRIATAHATCCARPGAVPIHRTHLRRCWISRAEDGQASSPDRLLEDRDRQAHRSPPLRRPAQTMDRRANLRLDQPQSPSRTRLRTLCPNRRRLRPPRNDPSHAQTPDQAKPLLMNPIFLDRLLRIRHSTSLRSPRLKAASSNLQP